MKVNSGMWTCLLDAFQEVVGDLEVTHDGSEIVWPAHGDPKCRRGFHIDELMLAAFDNGWQATFLNWNPQSSPTPHDEPTGLCNLETYQKGIIKLVLKNKYIAMGKLKSGGNHAKANTISGFIDLYGFVIFNLIRK